MAEWISVDDRLPSNKYKECISIIAASRIDGIGIATYTHAYGMRWVWKHKRVNGSSVIDDVTHWQPLPEPPID